MVSSCRRPSIGNTKPEVIIMSTSQIGSGRTVDDGGRADNHRRHAYRLFFAATAMLGISVFLPWASVAGIISTHMTAPGVVVVLALTGAYATIGHRVLNARDSRAAVVAAWVANVVTCLVIVAVYVALGKTEGIVEPAIGLLVASLGAMLAVGATVFLHRARKAVTAR
jgi:hypothetical protein